MPRASSTSRWQEDSVPLSQVRSMRAGAGMSLWMSYSARAVAGAPLSGMNRANSLRVFSQVGVLGLVM